MAITITKTENHYRVQSTINEVEYKALVVVSDNTILRISEGVINKGTKHLGNFWNETSGNLNTNLNISEGFTEILSGLADFLSEVRTYQF